MLKCFNSSGHRSSDSFQSSWRVPWDLRYSVCNIPIWPLACRVCQTWSLWTLNWKSSSLCWLNWMPCRTSLQVHFVSGAFALPTSSRKIFLHFHPDVNRHGQESPVVFWSCPPVGNTEDEFLINSSHSSAFCSWWCRSGIRLFLATKFTFHS